MIKKALVAQLIFCLVLCYIIAPWFFERNFLFNELFAAIALLILAYKRFRISKDFITLNLLLLIGWGIVHAVVSLFRADNAYYYLRNLVIVYSMLSYFIGYFLFPYLSKFLRKFRQPLQYYIGVFLFVPLPRLFFERFGVATVFPALIQRLKKNAFLPLLVIMNIIYAVSYRSSTTFLLALFYILLLAAPGYRFFKQVMVLILTAFTIFFIVVQPNLSLISLHYNLYDTKAIHEVMDSSPLLSIDGNSTWRLVLWKEVLVDLFPENLFGMGFGTPLIKYFPVQDYSKVETLPYVLGAHNSFVYLFGRLGLPYLVLTILMYRSVFREYFLFKRYHYSQRSILVFWSFFAITIIALLNPVLESPIFAGGYWLVLGLLAKCMVLRKQRFPITLAHEARANSSIH